MPLLSGRVDSLAGLHCLLPVGGHLPLYLPPTAQAMVSGSICGNHLMPRARRRKIRSGRLFSRLRPAPRATNHHPKVKETAGDLALQVHQRQREHDAEFIDLSWHNQEDGFADINATSMVRSRH